MLPYTVHLQCIGNTLNSAINTVHFLTILEVWPYRQTFYAHILPCTPWILL